MTDALGNLVRFNLLPGHRYDTIGVAPLVEGVKFEGLIADKAFDANWIIEEMNERGAKIVISQRPKRKQPLQIDAEIYKWRHLIENFFAKLKAFQRHRNAQRKNRPKLQRNDLRMCSRHQFSMNLNRP